MKEGLCFSCYDDITWRMQGMTDNFNAEIKRYTSEIHEGLTINCHNCGGIATYNRDESTGKWLQTYEEVVK